MTTDITDRDKHKAATIVGSMSDVVLGNLLKRDIAEALAAERRSEDALLASVMRKLLADHGGTAWGRYDGGAYWITVDAGIYITAEEMQAIDEAAPSS